MNPLPHAVEVQPISLRARKPEALIEVLDDPGERRGFGLVRAADPVVDGDDHALLGFERGLALEGLLQL
jgi:hypothetical protein